MIGEGGEGGRYSPPAPPPPPLGSATDPQFKEKCKQTLQNSHVTLRRLVHIVGVLVATQLAVIPAPLHYQGLQAQKNQGILFHSYNTIVEAASISRVLTRQVERNCRSRMLADSSVWKLSPAIFRNLIM